MSKSFMIAAVVCMLMPPGASADPLQGLYVAGGAGLNFSPALTADQNTDKVTTDPGGIGSTSLGWAFGNGFRLEANGGYSSNAITSISTRRTNSLILPISNGRGHETNYSVMANVAYDMPVSIFKLPVKPYVGIGIGYDWINFNQASGSENANIPLPQNNRYEGPATLHLGSTGSFAYQAFAGLAMPLNFVPGLDLTIEDKLIGAALANEHTTITATTGNNKINGSIPSYSRTAGYHPINNAVLVGLRYTFATK